MVKLDSKLSQANICHIRNYIGYFKHMCHDQSRADTLFRNASKMETTISKMYHIRISFRAATAALLLATGDMTSLAADAALLLATGDVATRSFAAAAALLLATSEVIPLDEDAALLLTTGDVATLSFGAAAALLLAIGDATSLAADAALLLATGDVATRSLAAAAALLLATGVHIAFERLGVAHQHLTA